MPRLESKEIEFCHIHRRRVRVLFEPKAVEDIRTALRANIAFVGFHVPMLSEIARRAIVVIRQLVVTMTRN